MATILDEQYAACDQRQRSKILKTVLGGQCAASDRQQISSSKSGTLQHGLESEI